MHQPPWKIVTFPTWNCLDKSTPTFSHAVTLKASKVPDISHIPLQVYGSPVLSVGPQALWLLVRSGQWGASQEIRGRRVKIQINFSCSLAEHLPRAAGNFIERSLSRSSIPDNSFFLASSLCVSPLSVLSLSLLLD